MRREALCVCVPYVIGLTLAARTRDLSLICCGVALVMTAVLLHNGALWKYVMLGTLSCLMACCVYWGREAALLVPQRALAGTAVTFTGTVRTADAYPSGYARYTLRGELAGTPAKVELLSEDTTLSYGDTLTLHGTPERIRPGYLFDSESYARAQGIVLRFGTETDCTGLRRREREDVRSLLLGWRSRMTERIHARMDEESGTMLTGMLFGDKADMPRRSRLAVNRMGIGHILVVSGLHLDFVAVCVGWLFERLRLQRWLSFLPMAVLALAFVICAGETIPVVRACIMLLIREGARLCARKADSLNSLCVAAFCICVVDPFAVCSTSFWLSCSAVWSMAVLAPAMVQGLPQGKWYQRLYAYFMGLVWASLGLLPVSAVFFREVSLVTPLSNALLLPVCLAAMLLGMLALLCGAQGAVAELLLRGADVLCRLVLEVSVTAGRLPWTHAALGSGVLLFLLFAGVFAVLLVHLWYRDSEITTWAVAAALGVTCAAYGARQALRRGEMHIAVLGQGRACLVAVTAGEDALLFDMTGHAGLAAYAQAYLTDSDTDRLALLYLAEPSEESLARYAMYLDLVPPGEITDGTGELVFHGACITAEPDGIRLCYAGRSVQCCRQQAAQTPQDVLAVYGRSRKALPDAGILIIPDGESPYLPDAHTYIGEHDLEVTIAGDGRCRVRRLYGDT